MSTVSLNVAPNHVQIYIMRAIWFHLMSAMIDNLRDYLFIINVSAGLIDIFLRVQELLLANQELKAMWFHVLGESELLAIEH